MVSRTFTSTRRTVAELSREAVIEHAMLIADTEGLDAVTMRRIAQDFSVTPMALYWHVKNKDELLAAMGDRLIERVDLPPDDLPWADQLRALIGALVDGLRRHPGVIELAVQRILQNERGQQLSEQALSVLRGAGLDVRQSSDLARAALQTAIMLVSGEPGAEFASPMGERDEVIAHKQAALKSLSPERFPNLIECADAMTSCDDVDQYYEFGVELFLAGVRELAAGRS